MGRKEDSFRELGWAGPAGLLGSCMGLRLLQLHQCSEVPLPSRSPGQQDPPTPGDYLGRARCWVPGSCGAEMLSLLRDCPEATDQLRQCLPLGLYVTGHAVRRGETCGVTTGGSAMLGHRVDPSQLAPGIHHCP